MAYAADTKVPVERSRAEIERILKRYGADQFVYGEDSETSSALIAFRAHRRHVRVRLSLPTLDEARRTPAGRTRAQGAAQTAHAQEARRRWRALALIIKAKLEAVESGITTFEEEFLPWTVLPSGETVAEWTAPQIERAYETGEMPSLLPQLERGR